MGRGNFDDFVYEIKSGVLQLLCMPCVVGV